MATRGVTYVDARDEFSYFSSNKFELLEYENDYNKVYENWHTNKKSVANRIPAKHKTIKNVEIIYKTN